MRSLAGTVRLSPGVTVALDVVFSHTSGGVDFYNVTSEFITEVTTLRILVPPTPAAVPHRTVFVLPVKPGLDAGFGDGLNELQALDAHNVYNCTLVAPSFPTEPWMGENLLDTGRRYESFILDLRTWCDANLAIADAVWGVSFSKGGVSVIHLLLRNPTLFDLIAAWDPPTSQTFRNDHDWQMVEAYGTEANYLAAFRPFELALTFNTATFLGSPRMWLSGDLGSFNGIPTNHNAQVFAFAQRLQDRSVPFGWMSGHFREHIWTSGWLVDAMAWLADPEAWVGPLELFPRPELVQLVHLQFPDTSGSGNAVTNGGASPNVTTATVQSGMAFVNDPEVGAVLHQPGTNGLDFGNAFLDIDVVDKSFFARLRVSSFGTFQTIVSKEDNEVLGYAFLITGDGHLHYHVSANVDIQDTGDPIPLDTWCTVGVSWNAFDRNARFYVNGVFQSEVNAPFGNEGSTISEPLLIGKSRNQSLFPFDGYWSEVQIYSGVLSDTDMLNLHTSGEVDPPGAGEPDAITYSEEYRDLYVTHPPLRRVGRGGWIDILDFTYVQVGTGSAGDMVFLQQLPPYSRLFLPKCLFYFAGFTSGMTLSLGWTHYIDADGVWQAPNPTGLFNAVALSDGTGLLHGGMMSVATPVAANPGSGVIMKNFRNRGPVDIFATFGEQPPGANAVLVGCLTVSNMGYG